MEKDKREGKDRSKVNLKSSGYKHIATINATLWIKTLLNSGDMSAVVADLEQ